MAAHRVEEHLKVSADDYDGAIRRFVPHYDESLRIAVETVAVALGAASFLRDANRLIVELGSGTGAFTDALAARLPEAHFLGVDCDAPMLANAQARLSRWSERVRLQEATFETCELPDRCAVVVASLALHHVRSLAAKTALYRRIFAALTPGGSFVNADAVLAADGPAREVALAAWVAHQAACGIPAAEARQNLENWQREEDRYFAFEEEFRALTEAGFSPAGIDIVWRRGPMAVLLACRAPA